MTLPMTNETEKTTAPNTSVGADDGQSLHALTETSISEDSGQSNPLDEDYQEVCRRMQRMSDPAYLHTVAMNELYENIYQSRPPVIDGLLYAGAYILAGAPKIGKSFLVAQLAYHVSTGQKLWNYEVRQSIVLYLALEDDYQRLQERMFRMFGVDDTKNLFFAIAAKQLGNGLDEQLEKFVREHQGTKLIVVDTLQKIREASGEAYSYASDYDIISKLKKFADRHGICVLIVHHTRKQPAGDSFEMISGTTGLLGCADGAFLMQKEKRASNMATLEVVGRDQADQKLYLFRDEEKLIWTLERAETKLWKMPPDPILAAVAKLVTPDHREWTGSPTELAEALNVGMAANALTKHLNINASRLLDEHYIKYENKTKHIGRRISLTYMVVDAAEYDSIG